MSFSYNNELNSNWGTHVLHGCTLTFTRIARAHNWTLRVLRVTNCFSTFAFSAVSCKAAWAIHFNELHAVFWYRSSEVLYIEKVQKEPMGTLIEESLNVSKLIKCAIFSHCLFPMWPHLNDFPVCTQMRKTWYMLWLSMVSFLSGTLAQLWEHTKLCLLNWTYKSYLQCFKLTEEWCILLWGL